MFSDLYVIIYVIIYVICGEIMIDYQKLYAYLVGKVDDALELLEEGDLVAARPIRELLHSALLRTEDAYIDATENPPQTIWVNPVNGSGKQD